MIKELADFGKRIRKTHDALKEERITIDLVIKEDGSFDGFIPIDITRTAEAITSKKGKARLLLDKAEEVLEYVTIDKNDDEKKIEDKKKAAKQKHKLFTAKLKEFEGLQIISPVIKFYIENSENGIQKARNEFENQIEEKKRNGNISFRVGNSRIIENETLLQAIIEKFERSQNLKKSKSSRVCSICGKNEFPVIDQPHGMIKNVPKGQKAGCAFISYNEKAFESYNLNGNENSSICSNCAKNYVEGLNFLLSKGNEIQVEDSKGKSKSYYKYDNRKNLGSDTAVVYWTKEQIELDELSLLDNPDEGQVTNLIESVVKGRKSDTNISTNKFFSLTVSGAAARVFVRDWIEMSLVEYRENIAVWFQDIAIKSYGKIQYPRLYSLANAGVNSNLKNDVTDARVSTILWKAALNKDYIPPLWIISSVLKRLRYVEAGDDGTSKKESMTPERASLIRIVLNRNNKKGGIMINEQLDTDNKNPAIICGRIFAVLESIQRAALGKNLNAGIRERFFSFASTNPAPAFGRLMKLSQNHHGKLKQYRPGVAFILDKQLQELCSKINGFPTNFSLEEQGQFALGYYHQKQADYEAYQKHEELKQLTMEEQ